MGIYPKLHFISANEKCEKHIFVGFISFFFFFKFDLKPGWYKLYTSLKQIQ